MKRGFGTLLVTTMAVAMFVSPNSVRTGTLTPSPTPSLATIQGASSTQDQPSFSPYTSFCKPIADDLLCQKCSELCPAQDLFDTIRSYYDSREQNKERWGVPSGF